MENDIVPAQLSAYIGSERSDFLVKSGRNRPLGSAIMQIIFGLFWTIISSIIAFFMLMPIFLGQESTMKINGVPTVVSSENWIPMIIPGIFIGIFVIIGLSILYGGILGIFQEGGYFAGTPTRLISFQDGNMRSIDWENFSGDIEVGGNDAKGSIVLQLKTGEMFSRKHGADEYVPDFITIYDIPNIFEIEQICRKRIKENDPTPATIGQNVI